MKIKITGLQPNGWDGIIKDEKNEIIFGAYINSKNELVLPTLYYSWESQKREKDSSFYEVQRFILENKPELKPPFFATIGKLSFIFLLVLLTSFSFSQNICIGGNYNTGNSGLFLINAQANIKNDSSKINWSISPNYIHSEVKNNDEWVEKQDEFYIDISLAKRKKDYTLYLFSDIEKSFQKNYKFRGLIGFGIGKNIINKEKIWVTTSIALMPEYYISKNNEEERSVRTSLRIRVETKGNVQFSSTDLIQPAILMEPYKISNINIRLLNSAKFPLNKKLSIGIQNLINISTLASYFNTQIKSTDITNSFILNYKL